MGLDAYVMPLWRFKAGDFTSPIEETFGTKPTVISLSAPRSVPAPLYIRLLAKIGIVEIVPPPPALTREERRAAAKQEVCALKAQLTEMTGTPIDWSDDGVVHYREQFRKPATMRAFAAWHDHRDEMPEFIVVAERDYDTHPVWSLPEPARRRFPTLVDHCLHTGYLLPLDFEGVHRVEPFLIWNHWEAFRNVASSHAMLREVNDFLEYLSTIPAANEPTPGPIPFPCIRWFAEELQRMCRLSLEHGLPVIFHG